jgi:hypothetical protein
MKAFYYAAIVIPYCSTGECNRIKRYICLSAH